MILFKSKKLKKFSEDIRKLCAEKAYELSGDLSKSFVVKTPDKTYNVSVLSTYRFKNSGITFISDKEAYLWSLIPLIKGFGGGISFPLGKTVKLSAADNSENAENVYVVYPKCMTIQFIEHEAKNTAWTPGKRIGNIRIFDGASFKDELRNPGLYTVEKKAAHSAVVSAVGI